jgi:aminoglycoside phosphotransferase (APT) family kinase protein
MGELCPGVAARLLGERRETHCFAMEYLDPARHPLWKQQLQQGVVSVAFARGVGDALGRMHASTADQDILAQRFATDENFHALRIEPYLEATGRAHPPLAPRLAALAQATVTHKRVLVHGDASPKNILAGPSGPIFLDAECAWYGDPAFDAAFVLNHLLLKCLLRPDARQALLESFVALADHYLDQVTWEDRGKLEMRIAALLPGLLLARVDGKSPVEYVTEEADKDRVRRIASELLRAPVPLHAVSQRWAQELSR